MLIENSIVVANFIKGIYVPLIIISCVAGFNLFVALIGFASSREAYTPDSAQAFWKKYFGWTIGCTIPYALFAMWFFSTFTLR